MSPRSVTLRRMIAATKAAWAASDARSGARRRSTSEAIRVVTTRRNATGGSPVRPRSRSRPTTASPTRSSCTLTPGALAISARSSAVERAATASTELERSISTSDASSARAAARTTSGSPRPDSTASDTAASEPRSTAAASWRAGEGTGSLLEAVVVVEEGHADGRPRAAQREQDVDAHDHGQQPLAQAPVRRPRGNEDEHRPGDHGDQPGGADQQIGDLVVGHGSAATL